MRDFFIITGLICTLCAVAVYHLVGAANPLYEAEDAIRGWSAICFAIPALTLFYFAWRFHVKERADQVDNLIIESGQTESDSVDLWLKQYSGDRSTNMTS